MKASESAFTGKLIRLRGIEPGDWEGFHANDADTAAARAADRMHLPRSEAAARAWAEEQSAHTDEEEDDCQLAIETLDGELVGAISTDGCDARNGTLRVGLAIFRPHWRKGYAADAMRTLLRYYFDELGYQKAMAHAYDFNEASLRLFEALGFTEEGRLRRVYRSGGRLHDEVVYGITDDELRARE